MREALAALPAPWVVLANRCASGADAPPWTRFIALHPRKGIALIDLDSPDAAVAPLEDFLSRAGLLALRDGAPPIVPVAVDGYESRAMAERLDAALPPLRGKLGNASWSKSTAQLLLATPDLALTRIRRAAAAAEETRATPPLYSRHAVEAWHGLLARSGMRRPDSALLDWSPRRGWRSLATVVALLLVTVGARAIQEYGPSRFQPDLTPLSTAAAPDLTADTLARAMVLPAPLPTVSVAAAAMPTIDKLPPIPSLATLTVPRQAFVPAQSTTVVKPRPKPATPAWFGDTDDRRSAPHRPKAAALADRVPQRGGDVDPAWYDRDATTPSNAGLTAFVAPGARHDALIPANLGTARLASGTTATLDFYGDGLLNVAISGKTLARAIDPSTGKPLGAAVGNTHALKAASGSVLVRANVAANAVDDVINTSGVVQASSASQQNGQIVLDGGAGGSGGTVPVVGTKDSPDNPGRRKAVVGGFPPHDQGVVYTTTAVTVAQDTAAEGQSIAAGVDGTAIGAVDRTATGAKATAASVGKAAAGTVGAAGSTLTSTVNSLTRPVTSLALPGR